MERIDVLCFGGQDWWYHNRGHTDMQLMRRYAKHGVVLYVNSIVMQKPKIYEGRRFIKKLLRKANSICMGLKKSDAGFWVYSPLTLPLHHISWAMRPSDWLLRFQILWVQRKLRMSGPLIWVTCPTACDTAIKLRTSELVYQRTDRFEEYPNVDYNIIREYDQKLKTSADLTLFANGSLYEQEHSQCKHALFLDHGVDYDIFAKAEQDPYKPEDIAHIPKPIVGFFGAIDDHTSNIALLEKLVDLMPETSFAFVGSASSDISGLSEKKNVWLLGQKKYEQIPHYGKCFDVAIMSWQQNRWIESCNPIKLKEYLALGKPIVSTPYPELQKYKNLVYQAKTPVEFAECIKQALLENDSGRISARRKKVQSSSWESKAQLVLEELRGEKIDFEGRD